MTPPPPQIQDALREAEDADLFVECARRTSHESDSLDEAAGWIIDAITGLYLLLEPASVRERRANP